MGEKCENGRKNQYGGRVEKTSSTESIFDKSRKTKARHFCYFSSEALHEL